MLPAFIEAWAFDPNYSGGVAIFAEVMADPGFASAGLAQPTLNPLQDLYALAAAQYTPNNFVIGGFHSSSNDPYVQWVDQMLYNNGQPLTAGSAQLYGTYFDPRIAALGRVINYLARNGIGDTLLLDLCGDRELSDATIELFGGTSSQVARSADQVLSQMG